MTKSLEQIQIENRKFILEAIHGCSYEEALKKELGFGCEVIARIWGTLRLTTINNLTCCLDREYGDYLRFRELVGDISIKDLTDEGLERLKEYQDARHRIIEIIGKPLTLSRVLLAFKNKEVKTCYGDEIIFNIAGSQFCGLMLEEECHSMYGVGDWNLHSIYGVCDWNLAIDEIPLEEQTEETQRAINKFFND